MKRKMILNITVIISLFTFGILHATAMDSPDVITNNPTENKITLNRCTNSTSSSSYWTKEYSLNEPEMTLTASEGGLLILGSNEHQGTTLFKVNEFGTTLWSWELNPDGDLWHQLFHIQETNDGGYILSGRTYSSITDTDILVVRLNASRNIIWQKTITTQSTSATEMGSSIIQTSDGGFLLAGTSNFWGDGDYYGVLIRLDQNGEIIWQKLYRYGEFYKMIRLPDSSILIGGEYYYEGQFNQDIWVVNLNPNGEIIWQKTYGGFGPEYLSDMILTNDNNIVILGSTQSFGAPNHETWVLQLNFIGDIIWQRMIGYWLGSNIGSSVLEVPDEGFYISGQTSSFGYGQSDAWLFFIDSTGELIWQVSYGGEYGDDFHTTNFANDGGLFITGHIGGNYGGLWIIKASDLNETCIPFEDTSTTIANTSGNVHTTTVNSENINLLINVGTAISQTEQLQSQIICPIPIISIFPEYEEVKEDGGHVTAIVTLDETPVFTSTVFIQTIDISTTASSDYTPIYETLIFEPGTLSQTISIPILDDSIPGEGNEVFVVQLSNPINSILGNTYSFVMIFDNDEYYYINLPFVQK